MAFFKATHGKHHIKMKMRPAGYIPVDPGYSENISPFNKRV